MHDEQGPVAQALYLFKIIAGLAALGGLALAAFHLDRIAPSSGGRELLAAALAVLAAGMVPFARRAYRRADELRRSLHQAACVGTLPIVAALSAVLGILQATGMVEEFNPFFFLGAIVAVWGVQLMLADRRYR